MEELPCINCISLPVCLGIFHTINDSLNDGLKTKRISLLFIRPLTSKCCLLSSYLLDYSSRGTSSMYSTVKILEVYDYFDGITNIPNSE